MTYDRERAIAIAAVIAAAKLCEQVRSGRSPEAIEKQDRSPVTIADLGAQAIICRALAEVFPADPVVGEEDAHLLRQPDRAPQLQQVTEFVQAIVPDATAPSILEWIDRGNGQVCSRYWTLDPIDGTKGFLRGDQYAIALALVEDGDVKVGVMGCPAYPLDLGTGGGLFVAVRGQGTTLLSLADGTSRPIQVSHQPTSECFRMTESIEVSHGNLELQRRVAEAAGLTAPPLKMDSQAKYGAVACGQAALYLRLPWSRTPDYRENIWDHAAGAIAVEEAGGRVTDMDGKPLDFASDAKFLHNRGIVASNGILHNTVLSLLREKMSA